MSNEDGWPPMKYEWYIIMPCNSRGKQYSCKKEKKFSISSSPPSIKIRLSQFIPLRPSISFPNTSINRFSKRYLYPYSLISLPWWHMICEIINSARHEIFNLKSLGIAGHADGHAVDYHRRRLSVYWGYGGLHVMYLYLLLSCTSYEE